MSSSRKQLQDTIWQLEHRKPKWQIAEPNPIVFWPAFQGACQETLDSAGSADHNWVQCKLWELLEGHT